jgi:phenylpropionate dioxygenase-like ring-hydroxylating dioxygenase large terminal subunit
MITKNYTKFNQSNVVLEGWYWITKSSSVKKKKVIPYKLMGRDLAVYRGQDDKIRVIDAFCPHMGAHLAEGKVENNSIRCFFHNWCFDQSGICTEIPCLDKNPSSQIRLKHWHSQERYGLIWVWVGQGAPPHDIPKPLGLGDSDIDWSLGNRFIKECHPHIVMINAIDEQHFHSVHHLPGSILYLEPRIVDQWCLDFYNTKKIPPTSRIRRFFGLFYKNELYYQLNYWYGCVGVTSFGPDFLRLHLMFALRHRSDGKTEGQTIAFTKKRKGVFGVLINRVILTLTKLGGLFFAYGDTKIFKTIRFNLKNPIPADKSVIAFMRHIENQNIVDWRT